MQDQYRFQLRKKLILFGSLIILVVIAIAYFSK